MTGAVSRADSTFEQSMHDFFQSQTGAPSISLERIITFIESSLLQHRMSFREHQDFHPVVDELVVYINEWRSENQLADSATLEHASTLLHFGIAYEV